MKDLIKIITVTIVSMAVFTLFLFPLMEVINFLLAVAIACASSVFSMMFTHRLMSKN
jgi:hypothetical protein